MKIEVVVDKDTYQAAWRDTKGCFTQSWGWGEAKRPSQEPSRLVVDGKPWQILARTLPILGGRFGYVPRAFSPLSLPSPTDLQAAAKTICEEQRLTHLIIEPDIWQEPCDEMIWQQAGFKISQKTIQPRYSRWLDLTLSEEELFGRLAKDVRRRAKRAEETGVRFIEDTSTRGLETFYETLLGATDACHCRHRV